MTTKDFLAFRPLLAEMLARGAQSIVGKRLGDADVAKLNELGRGFFGSNPATFDAFRKWLAKEHPRLDTRAVAYTARMGVPLVMVPTEVAWSFGASADFTLAEHWLDSKAAKAASVQTLVMRYLAAFGPATPGDFQTWSGIRGAREVFEKLRGKLTTFRDEKNRELFDLPDAPRPDADTPAPIRFLPEYDNALLSHEDRTRIIADEHRGLVFLKNLVVVGSFLVDGLVAGTWRVERGRKTATLTLNRFARIPQKTLASLQEEGEALLDFIEPEAASREVRVSTR